MRGQARGNAHGYRNGSRWPIAAAVLAVSFTWAGLAVLGCSPGDAADDDAEDDDAEDDDTEGGVHDPLDDLLTQFTVVDGGGNVLVEYDSLDADSVASASLTDYLDQLAGLDPATLTGDTDRLAYWLNGYNASVLQGVLANYGGDHAFTVLDSGTFFDEEASALAGVPMSLNQIEHGVIRGKMDHSSVSGAAPSVQSAIEGGGSSLVL